MKQYSAFVEAGSRLDLVNEGKENRKQASMTMEEALQFASMNPDDIESLLAPYHLDTEEPERLFQVLKSNINDPYAIPPVPENYGTVIVHPITSITIGGDLHKYSFEVLRLRKPPIYIDYVFTRPCIESQIRRFKGVGVCCRANPELEWIGLDPEEEHLRFPKLHLSIMAELEASGIQYTRDVVRPELYGLSEAYPGLEFAHTIHAEIGGFGLDFLFTPEEEFLMVLPTVHVEDNASTLLERLYMDDMRVLRDAGIPYQEEVRFEPYNREAGGLCEVIRYVKYSIAGIRYRITYLEDFEFCGIDAWDGERYQSTDKSRSDLV